MTSKLLIALISMAFLISCKTSQNQNADSSSINGRAPFNGEERIYVAVESSVGKDLEQSENHWEQICEKYSEAFKGFFKERFISFDCLGGADLMEREAKTKPECADNEDGQEVLSDCYSEGLLIVKVDGPSAEDEPRIFYKTKDVYDSKKDEYAKTPTDEVAIDLCLKLQIKAQKDYGAGFIAVNCASAGRWGGEDLYWYQAEGNVKLLDSVARIGGNFDLEEIYIAVETQKSEKRWQEICTQYNTAFRTFFKERFIRFDCLEGAKLMDREVLKKPECIDSREDGELLNGCNSEGLLVVKTKGKVAAEEPRIFYQTSPVSSEEKDEYENRPADEVAVDLCIKLQSLGMKDYAQRFIAASCDGSGRTVADAKHWYEAEGKARITEN